MCKILLHVIGYAVKILGRKMNTWT